jgi:hypothetical protein
MTLVRRLALLIAICAFASNAFATERFTPAQWRRVKVYDMEALKTLDPLPLRQYVGVRFQYRQPRIEHWKPNWYECSIWCYRREAKDQFDYIPVIVSKADLAAFQALPSDLRQRGNFLAYGQVLKDVDANFTFLRLVGTRVKRERGGRVIAVSW